MSSKRYDEEFKRQVVDEYLKGKSTIAISKAYGIAKSTVSEWARKYSEECRYSKPQNAADMMSAEEIRKLNKKIAELEKENNFLKKAAAFFAKEID